MVPLSSTDREFLDVLRTLWQKSTFNDNLVILGFTMFPEQQQQPFITNTNTSNTTIN